MKLECKVISNLQDILWSAGVVGVGGIMREDLGLSSRGHDLQAESFRFNPWQFPWKVLK